MKPIRFVLDVGEEVHWLVIVLGLLGISTWTGATARMGDSLTIAILCLMGALEAGLYGYWLNDALNQDLERKTETQGGTAD